MENGIVIGYVLLMESYMAGQKQLSKEMKLPYTLNTLKWEVKMNFLQKKFS